VKRWVIPLMLGFGVTLAYLIGQRMSTDAMAVVIGVAVGVAASVPMSVLLVALLRRESGRREAAHQPMPAGYGYGSQQQPVVVINPADLLNRQQGPTYGLTGPMTALPPAAGYAAIPPGYAAPPGAGWGQQPPQDPTGGWGGPYGGMQ
jgi:hypothetical protein